MTAKEKIAMDLFVDHCVEVHPDLFDKNLSKSEPCPGGCPPCPPGPESDRSTKGEQ